MIRRPLISLLDRRPPSPPGRGPAEQRRAALASSGASPFAALFVLAALIALGGAACQRAPASPREELVRALQGRRPVEPRLVGGSESAECRRAAEPGDLIPNAICSPLPSPGTAGFGRLAQAGERIRRAAIERPAADTLHAEGTWHLVWGESHPEAIDLAVDRLEQAAAIAPGDASILSDLSAAYYVRAQLRDRPLDLVSGYSRAVRARELRPDDETVLFNLALLADRLFLRKAAAATEGHLRRLGADERWARDDDRETPRAALDWSEHGEELRRLALAGEDAALRQLIALSPQASRWFVEERLIPEWVEARDVGSRETAGRLLKAAGTVSGLLVQETGDGLLEAAIRSVDHASGSARDELLAAHRLYEKAASLYRGPNRDSSAAGALFRRASGALSRAGSPYVLWADFYAAACDYLQKDYESARRQGSRIQAAAHRLGYPNLRARASWLLGLISLERADAFSALAEFQTALAAFERTGEVGNQGSMHSLIASTLTSLGDRDRAWTARYQALRAISAAGDRARLPIVFNEVARALALEDLPEASLAYLDEVVDLEMESGDPLAISEAYWWRGLAQQAAGNEAEASEALARAREHCARIADGKVRDQIAAGLGALEGAILRLQSPREAVSALSRSLERYAALDYAYLRPTLLLERARAYRSLDLPLEAEDDLAAGIEFFESRFDALSEASQRQPFFAQAKDFFDEMVLVQARYGADPAKTLSWAERGKARSFLAAMGAGDSARASGSGFDAGELRRRLPPGTTFISYYLGRQGVFVSALRAEDARIRELPISPPRLSALSREFVEAILDARAQRIDELSERLYLQLIEPVAAALDGSRRVIVAPDGALNLVPFAALRDPATGRFLIEDVLLTSIPSGAAFLQARSGASGPTGRDPSDWTALAVGNPALDRRLFPDFPDLPFAAGEARKIAEAFPGSVLLEGSAATGDRFLEEINRHDLIHFAGHSVPEEPGSPGAKLLFSGPANQETGGALPARRIYRLRLDRPRLVILASCDSAGGTVSSLEGVNNLVRPFLAAGAPEVLASLWPLDDETSQSLIQGFITHLKNGRSAAEALRLVQMSLARSPGRGAEMRKWAPLVLFSVHVTNPQEDSA